MTGGQENFDQPLARASDINQITRLDYNAAGWVSARTALDPAADGNATGHTSDNQTTRYIYVGDLPSFYQPYVPRGDLVRAVIYPDSALSTQDAMSLLHIGFSSNHPPAGTDMVSYTYKTDGSR